MGILINVLKKVFNIPLVRHIIAGVIIIFGIWVTVVNPLYKQNHSLIKIYQKMSDRQYRLISELSKRPTYHIENDVDLKKQKDGSVVNFVPDNTMSVKNGFDSLRFEIIKDTEQINTDFQKDKEKTWVGKVISKLKFW